MKSLMHKVVIVEDTIKKDNRKGKNVQTGYKDILNSKKEYYEIRLESIGGLGANLCGKMLGELGIKYLDVNSSSFSSYGSEKTGTPVKGFIRFSKKDKEIREHSPIRKPDLLVVFHQALLGKDSVLEGCDENTGILIAAKKGEKQISLPVSSRIYRVYAQEIAIETKSRINVVMLGAMLKIMGMDQLEYGEKMIVDMLGKKYPASLESNLNGMRRGYEEVEEYSFPAKDHPKEKQVFPAKSKEEKKETQWGYLNAPLGGINPHAGNSILSDLSPSRQGYIPLFLKEKCINCGLCFSTCPDMVFQFVKGEFNGRKMMINQGLDYYHCKGCLRCVEVCPVNALISGMEEEHEKKKHFVPNQELIRMPKYYEKAGADGYITSESYLTEKRMEGGEV